MRAFVTVATIIAAALAVPAVASAGQIVYSTAPDMGTDQLWVMNEDGSGQRPWLDAFDDLPASGGTRFVTVFSPEISVDGRRVVFTAQTLANKEPGGLALGAFAQGVYLWQDGTARRLSPPPAPAEGISTFESDGAPATDGRIYDSLTGGSYTSSNTIASTFGDLRVLGADGSDLGSFGAACEGIGLGTAGGPKPSPVDPGLVVYGGCTDGEGQETIHVSRAQRAGDRVVRTAPASPDGYGSDARDPAWRPDGGRIVSVESAGQDPDRIVTYAPDGSGARTVLVAPAGTQLSGPHYVGADRIVFGTSSDAAGTDISIVDAACSSCALTAARQLTSGGISQSPSWSAAGLVEPAPRPRRSPSPRRPPRPRPRPCRARPGRPARRRPGRRRRGRPPPRSPRCAPRRPPAGSPCGSRSPAAPRSA